MLLIKSLWLPCYHSFYYAKDGSIPRGKFPRTPLSLISVGYLFVLLKSIVDHDTSLILFSYLFYYADSPWTDLPPTKSTLQLLRRGSLTVNTTLISLYVKHVFVQRPPPCLRSRNSVRTRPYKLLRSPPGTPMSCRIFFPPTLVTTSLVQTPIC